MNDATSNPETPLIEDHILAMLRLAIQDSAPMGLEQDVHSESFFYYWQHALPYAMEKVLRDVFSASVSNYRGEYLGLIFGMECGGATTGKQNWQHLLKVLKEVVGDLEEALAEYGQDDREILEEASRTK